MEEPAQLVCWCMELIKISYEELQILGEASVLAKVDKTSGLEHIKITPNKWRWWNTDNEEWVTFGASFNVSNYLKNAKEIYLIVEE